MSAKQPHAFRCSGCGAVVRLQSEETVLAYEAAERQLCWQCYVGCKIVFYNAQDAAELIKNSERSKPAEPNNGNNRSTHERNQSR